MQNGEYDYKTLHNKAVKAELWISVADKAVRRGRSTGNTSKKERVSRALSWYEQSEKTASDRRLIFAFIAFNALYALEYDYNNEQGLVTGSKESQSRNEFLERINNVRGSAEYFDFTEKEAKNMEKILQLPYLSKALWHNPGDEQKVCEDLK